MRNFKMGIRRLGASLSALLMVCCLTVPALAAGNNWPASPSADDFSKHLNCWYVWNTVSLNGIHGYELISSPMVENGSTNTVYISEDFSSYSTNSRTFEFTFSDGSRSIFMYAFPQIAWGASGYWADLPSFPVGTPNATCGTVRLYPSIQRNYLSTVDDVFSDRFVYGFLTSWPASSDSSIVRSYGSSYLNDMPIYFPSNVFFFGDRTVTGSNVTGFGIEDGYNDFWATPFNGKYIDFTSSHLSNPYYAPFPDRFSLSSSDLGFVFCKRPSSSGMHAYNSEFNVTLDFIPTLWVPDALLPNDVKVGDWITRSSIEGLQDQLVNDFGVNSDTLKDYKQNFDSWQNSYTVDEDVASTSLQLVIGLFSNFRDFLTVVALLCFGAVVLRVLIRKAVQG